MTTEFLAFSDELQKIAAKRSLLGRVKGFLDEGRKGGFLIDKKQVELARKHHGGVGKYLTSKAQPNEGTFGIVPPSVRGRV